ncbi:MAG: TIGR02996 domain-containing protein [Planctomycetes bacterium]|nr:TIGR02996 domain-containing protein [Planctomycetota bacterium]
MDAEERALIAAIIANPDEDTPRLVYADWLDEHADALPEERRTEARARAELIRVQVERAALLFGEPGFTTRDYPLGRRAEEIAEEHMRSWVRELPGAARRGVTFALDRGFVGAVRCGVPYFIETGAALMNAAPVTAARLTGLNRRNVRRLISSGTVERLHTLMLFADDTPHDAIGELLECAAVPRLTALYLDNGSVDDPDYPTRRGRSDELIARVAGLTRLTGLRRLVLFAAGVSGHGAEALLRAEHLAGLEVLDLCENPSLGPARKALRDKFGNRVWLDHGDQAGFPARYRYCNELSGA